MRCRLSQPFASSEGLQVNRVFTYPFGDERVKVVEMENGFRVERGCVGPVGIDNLGP